MDLLMRVPRLALLLLAFTLVFLIFRSPPKPTFTPQPNIKDDFPKFKPATTGSYEGEDGSPLSNTSLSYQQLWEHVCQLTRAGQGPGLGRLPAQRPEQRHLIQLAINKSLEFTSMPCDWNDKVACLDLSVVGGSGVGALPTMFVVGLAKTGTTAFWNLLRQNTQHVSQVRKKEQEFWNKVFFHHSWERTRTNFHSYVQRYAQDMQGTARIGLDPSPLYWRGPDTRYELRAAIPDARLVFFFREPVARAFSSYRYFCKQERAAGGGRCSTGEWEARVRHAVDYLRNLTCGPLGRPGPYPYPQCAQFKALTPHPQPSPRAYWLPSSEDQYESVWPADEPSIARDWWRLWGELGQTDHVFRGAILEGIYWPRLLEWYEAWPAAQLYNALSDDLEAEPERATAAIARFYGLPDHEYANIDRGKANVGYDRQEIVLSPATRRLLEKIFRPHLEKHAALLQHWLDTGRLPA